MKRSGTLIVYSVMVARLGLAGWLCAEIIHSSAAAILALICVIVADIGDGWLARCLSLDSVWRRAADAGIDRLTIHAAFMTALRVHSELWPWYLPLLIRDVCAAAGSSYGIARWRYFLVGDRWHRAASLTAAAQGIAFLYPTSAGILTTSLIAWLANYILLTAHAGVFMHALNGCRVDPQAGTLRRIDSRAVNGLGLVFRFGARSKHMPQPNPSG